MHPANSHIEQYARRHSHFAHLSRALARDAQGRSILHVETLWLDVEGGYHIEQDDTLVGVQDGWVRRGGGDRTVYTDAEALAALAHLPDTDVVFRGTDEIVVPIPPREKIWGHFAPHYRPYTDSEQADEQARLDTLPTHQLDSWPSETCSGVVRLAGSQDRWVISVGVGGHTQNIPGAYPTAEEAREALVAIITERQAIIQRVITERTAPHAIQCRFPALDITTIGDESIVAPTLENRAARRAHLQRSLP